MIKHISGYFNTSINSIPKAHRNQFQEERLGINLSRERIYAIILIIWNILMFLYIGLGAFNQTWIKMPAYKYELYLHIAGLIFSVLFIIQFSRTKKLRIQHKIFRNFINLGFITFLLNWTVVMTIIDLLINQQIVVYIMGIMIVSVSLILSPKESFLIYGSTYLLLVVGTVLTQSNPVLIESCILNGIMIVVLGLIISNIIFGLHVKDFMKTKTIYEKTLELKHSQESLEIALIKRTEELACANEQLVKEINNRHTLEIQALKSEFEYQKKQTELDEAKEYDRIRGEFFSNISHELRTPLNIIFCAMQMVNGYLEQEEVAIDINNMSKYIILMRQNSYRLLRLINNIIDITKIDSGYLSISPSNVDIIQIVENITMSVAPYAECNGYTIIFDTEVEDKIISCDPNMIERILLNLLSNAIKFSPSGSNIFVNIHESNSSIVIKVKDFGMGIPKDKQKIIFDRFIQVDKSTTREKEGSGIGLSLVKSLVELHNGTISVVSEIGKGSEFIIELPDIVIESDEIIVENAGDRVLGYVEAINKEFSDIYS